SSSESRDGARTNRVRSPCTGIELLAISSLRTNTEVISKTHSPVTHANHRPLFLTSMRKPLLSSRSREDHGISKHPFGIFASSEPPCCVIRLLPFTVTASRRHVRNRDAAMNPAIGLTSQ